MITKEVIADKIEILENGTIQIREKTRFYEDGVKINESNTDRRVITPVESVFNENETIQAIAGCVRTAQKVYDFAANSNKKKTV